MSEWTVRIASVGDWVGIVAYLPDMRDYEKLVSAWPSKGATTGDIAEAFERIAVAMRRAEAKGL